jgi:hypothetical protein
MVVNATFSNISVISLRDRCDHDCLVVDLHLPVQSVPITTKIVSSKPFHGELYSIQHNVKKFVSDLGHVHGIL